LPSCWDSTRSLPIDASRDGRDTFASKTVVAVPLLIDDGDAGMKSDCVEPFAVAVHKDLSGRRRAWRSASLINQQAPRHRSSGELSGIDSPLRAAGAVRPQDTR
jgi:hypothetical protein